MVEGAGRADNLKDGLCERNKTVCISMTKSGAGWTAGAANAAAPLSCFKNRFQNAGKPSACGGTAHNSASFRTNMLKMAR